MLIKYTGSTSFQEFPYTGNYALWQPGQISDINNDRANLLTGLDIFSLIGYDYNEVNATDYNIIPDANIDNTIFLQKAINDSARSGRVLELPAGILNFTDLYLYYDPVLNPGYPNTTIADQGRLRISGQGRMFVLDTYYGSSTGTVLNCTSSTGGIHQDMPTGGNLYSSSGYIFKELTIKGNTSGTLVNLQNVNNIEFKNVLIMNFSLTGNGCYLGSCYILVVDGFEVLGGTAGYDRNPQFFSTGTGLTLNGNGGFASGNYTTSGFNIGTLFNGSHTQIRFGHHEPHHCNIGVVFDGTGITNGVGFNAFWAEGCTYSGIKCINGATMPSLGTARIEQPVGDWTTGRTITKIGSTLTFGGNIYQYTDLGTTGATGPTGTGTGIADGTATCKFVGVLASETRACIHQADASTPSEATRSWLGDLYLTVDCGTHAFRHVAVQNSQEIEISSLTVASANGTFVGHTARNGITLSETNQPGVITVHSAQFIGFDSVDSKCSQFSHLAYFHETKKGKTRNMYNTNTSASLSMTNGDIIRILDSAVTITALESQYSGSRVVLFMVVSGIKIVNSATLQLENGLDYTSTAGDILTFMSSGISNSLFAVTWTEEARSVKSGWCKTAISTTTSTPFTIVDATGTIICSVASTCTLVLPTASNYKGRILTVRTTTAQTVVSGSSNVSIDGVVGTAILAATAGKWAKLQSDGTNWVMIENN